MRLIAAMENASSSNDVWNNVTTSSSSQPEDLTSYLANIRDLALKVVYITIGIVGVVDNLFVLVVFFLFIKITEKVLHNLEFASSKHGIYLSTQLLARDVIHTSGAYAVMSVSVCLSVRLSVTEVHWRIIANLRFKF